MYNIEYGPNVVGKKENQLYITTEGSLSDLSKKMVEYGFAHVLIKGALVISNTSLGDLLELVGRANVATTDKRITKRIKDSTIVPELPLKEDVTYPEFKLPLHKYQKEAVFYGIKNERYLLADGLGVGKSLSAMATALYLKAHFDFKYILVVNGINSNQHNYASELTKFTHATYKILGMRELTTGKRKGQFEIRGAKEKIEDLQNPTETFLITNIEALRNKDIVSNLEKLIKSGDLGMVIMDEIHKVVKPSTLQGKGLLKLRPRFRMGMSGTPFNKPENMYATATWLGRTYYNQNDYQRNYGRLELENNRPVYVFTEHEKFKKDLNKYMLRRLDGIAELPPISFTDVMLDLPADQRRAYEAVRADYVPFTGSLDAMNDYYNGLEHIEGRKVINIPATMGVKSDIKLDTIKELLSEIIANGKTALVYTYFVAAGQYYSEELEKTFPKQGNYVTEHTDAFTVATEFQKGKGSFLVGSVGKIGTGLTLTRADYVIFADRPSSWGVYEQAFMRPWRQGRKDPVHVMKLICRDTWDDAISLSQQEMKFNSDNILGKIHGDKAVGHEDAIER